mmetsp:Transcript_82537/g.145605  ORF Transcript_82537/g.145605 Transcript_82537/m.145605 type:complete len:88 (-) Transcript_82537:206-469(-)
MGIFNGLQHFVLRKGVCPFSTLHSLKDFNGENEMQQEYSFGPKNVADVEGYSIVCSTCYKERHFHLLFKWNQHQSGLHNLGMKASML